ncbi:enzyme binding [Dermatophagoides farinae]|uniref:Enzyme binding n=1 Tax=Dermatophagoides farinae TaxID=6954 RepID=A0A922LAB0_DERFA|nr:enzyme binding [Dermatophagoides farinae]
MDSCIAATTTTTNVADDGDDDNDGIESNHHSHKILLIDQSTEMDLNILHQKPPPLPPPLPSSTTNTSQQALSSDGLHWCPGMDIYHLSNCDNNNICRNTSLNVDSISNNQHSQISFTLTSSGSAAANEIPDNNIDDDSIHRNRHHHKINRPNESASSASSSSSSSKFLINNNTNNYDIHLAQIDIETFKSEDIRKIPFNHHHHQSMMNVSNDDTLRIVDSISSFTNHLLQPPIPSNDTALSIDSLDISIDNDEINSELIQKCAEKNDKTKYKIAMIDSQMHGSNISTNPFQQSPLPMIMNDSSLNLQSPGTLVKMFIQNKQLINSNENSMSSSLMFDTKNINNNNNNNNITSNIDVPSKFDNNSFRLNNNDYNNGGNGNLIANGCLDNMANTSLNTIDSNELPLHVIDLSKKLRSLNLSSNSKQQQQQTSMMNNNNSNIRYIGSTSSNTTSFASTTTTTSSSAATNGDVYNKLRQRHNHDHRQRIVTAATNPFLNISETETNSSGKKTRSMATQFPDLFQDKEVQASFDDDDVDDVDGSDVIKEAPVLVYYPNYSLPDLSFLQEIFHPENHPVYLSPVKHEPIKTSTVPEISSNVKMRTHTNMSARRKCRPKSYTDYETLLNQDLSHIKDWDSLNLLLPDDFREFIEQNNLLKLNQNSSSETEENQSQCYERQSAKNIPIKKMMMPNNHRLFQNGIRMRPHSMRQNSMMNRNKRYSLQEHQYNHYNNHQNMYFNNPNYNPNRTTNEQQPYPTTNSNEYDIINSFMTRSQTMPNCQAMAFNAPPPPSMIPGFSGAYYHMPHQLPPSSSNAVHHTQHHSGRHPINCYNTCCCHSGCHSPSTMATSSSQQSSSSPHLQQKPPPNLNWELLSSSTSFKKLLTFLSKLDEYSSTHSSSADTATITGNNNNNNETNASDGNRRNDNFKTKSHSQRNDNLRQTMNSQQQQQKQAQIKDDQQNYPNSSGKNNNHHHHNKSSSSKKHSNSHGNRKTTSAANVQTMKNSSSKIILKRPMIINRQHSSTAVTSSSSSSGIPIPSRRISSMIPVLNKNSPNNHQTYSGQNNNGKNMSRF